MLHIQESVDVAGSEVNVDPFTASFLHDLHASVEFVDLKKPLAQATHKPFSNVVPDGEVGVAYELEG